MLVIEITQVDDWNVFYDLTQAWWMVSATCISVHSYQTLRETHGPDYKKILRLSYDVIITYDNRKSNLW